LRDACESSGDVDPARLFEQIAPSRIVVTNLRECPVALPGFELLFAMDGGFNVVEVFAVDVLGDLFDGVQGVRVGP